MREDMAKVIVERPRIKSRWASLTSPRSAQASEERNFIGMNRFHAERHGTKALNENLAPLKRYLFKQVGRPWNTIYSEISAHLRADNPVQQHVRDHLKDYVEIAPRPDVKTRHSRWTEAPWRQPLYVHPKTGLLCRTDSLAEVKAARRQAKAVSPKPITRIVLKPDLELRQIDGLWYEIHKAPIPAPQYRDDVKTVIKTIGYGPKRRTIESRHKIRVLVTPSVRDVATGAAIPAGPLEDNELGWLRYRGEYRDRFYAVSKRALSRKALKRHGLMS